MFYEHEWALLFIRWPEDLLIPQGTNNWQNNNLIDKSELKKQKMTL